MTRRRKTLLAVFALVFLAAGAFAWYWQATAGTAAERQVDALLAQLRRQEPGFVERWLMKLGVRKGRRTLSEVSGDLAKLGPSAVPYLIRALGDEHAGVRTAAVLALEKLGDARAVHPLIAALKDESSRVRSYAADALGTLGDARAFEPLVAALKDEDEDVRPWAARGLGKLGDARAVEPLIAALKDEHRRVRRFAAWALGSLGDARAVEPLEELLGDEHEGVRKIAREAIEQLRAQSGAESRPSRQALDEP